MRMFTPGPSAFRAALIGLGISFACHDAPAQFTLPGGIKIQVPNTRLPPASTIPVRANPDQVCPNLVNWVKPLHDEYPAVNLMSIPVDHLFVMEIPLFADQNFTPFFHRRYTDFSPTELDAIFRQQMIPCMQSAYRNQLPGVDYAFQTRSAGPLSYTQLPSELASLAQARSSIAQVTAALATMPASPASYDELQSGTTALASALQLVWPSERQAYSQAITAAQVRLAPAMLEAKVQPLLAQPATLQALQMLRNLPVQNAALYKLVPPAELQPIQQRVSARADAIGATLLAQQRTTMLSFPGTEAGLKDGAAWLATYQATYLGLIPNGGDTLVHEYEQRREKQLAAREPEIRRRLEAAATEYALKPMLDGIFVLPSDRTTPLYSRMQQIVVTRSEALEKHATATAEAETQTAAKVQARRAAVEEPRRSAAVRPSGTGPRTRGDRTVVPAVLEEQRPAASLSTTSFRTSGLANSPIMEGMYQGDFEKLNFERGDFTFAGLINGYILAYWNHCASSLPADRVQVMENYCAASHHWQNRYGMQTTPEVCDDWELQPTGRWADPRIYSAEQQLGLQQTREVYRTTIQLLTSGDSIGRAMNLVGTVNSLRNDIDQVVQMNACTGPGMMRFQENLRLFALGKQPVRIDGTQLHLVGTDAPRPGQTFRDSDYTRLLNDLLVEQSKTWMLNRYQTNTIARTRVTTRDASGRPAAVDADYSFISGMSGKPAQASVTLKFEDGVPECLLFSDMPMDCRTPNRKIVSAYAGGGYQ